MFGLRRWLRSRALVRAAVDDAQWIQAVDRCRLVRHLDAGARVRLREQVSLFLDAKQFTPAGGLELTPEMRLTIALQACVLVLELGIDSYAPWVEVIVYPDEFMVEREEVDDAGVVHQVREPLSGESWADGPVILSWADVEAANPQDGYNVVVHEFSSIASSAWNVPNCRPVARGAGRQDSNIHRRRSPTAGTPCPWGPMPARTRRNSSPARARYSSKPRSACTPRIPPSMASCRGSIVRIPWAQVFCHRDDKSDHRSSVSIAPCRFPPAR
jgi:hypothetical protein